VNVLFVTLDQFPPTASRVRATAGPHAQPRPTGRAGHPLLPALQPVAPCSRARLPLHRTYQMNNRVVANGTPHDERLDNVALAARRAGLRTRAFRYTDQAWTPAPCGPATAPVGLRGVLRASTPSTRWTRASPLARMAVRPGARCRRRRHRAGHRGRAVVELSASAYQTDQLLEWLLSREGPWFAHMSFWRPHPPYAGQARGRCLRPGRRGAARSHRRTTCTPLHTAALAMPQTAVPREEGAIRRLRAHTTAMVSHGRRATRCIWAGALRARDVVREVIVVTPTR